jgi:hypothetical protein
MHGGLLPLTVIDEDDLVLTRAKKNPTIHNISPRKFLQDFIKFQLHQHTKASELIEIESACRPSIAKSFFIGRVSRNLMFKSSSMRTSQYFFYRLTLLALSVAGV